MQSFFRINNLKSHKKWRSPCFDIKIFKSCEVVMEFFLSFKSFKSRKKVIESF